MYVPEQKYSRTYLVTDAEYGRTPYLRAQGNVKEHSGASGSIAMLSLRDVYKTCAKGCRQGNSMHGYVEYAGDGEAFGYEKLPL